MLVGCKDTEENSQAASTDKESRNFQSIVDSIYRENPESIGIMVHIESPKNGISWSGSSGYSDKENKTELFADQPALIASSIKTYISASILRLHEQGKLSIDDTIGSHLTQKTSELFEKDGYNLDRITIKHLLSHTSGIQDYANEAYLNWIDDNPKHRWTRDEQLILTTKVGDPLGEPQAIFNYSDANYLLCTEIIEQVTQKPFYEAISVLLKYDEFHFKNTWFPTLEDKPITAKDLVHQYWSERSWDSHNMDISFDLYGGGGIATTTKELAQFSYNLFTHKIIEDSAVLKLLSTEIKTEDGKNNNYGLGLSLGKTNGLTRYGHGGFWGSQVFYFPKLDLSISVFVLERDVKGKVIKQTMELLLNELSNELIVESFTVGKESL